MRRNPGPRRSNEIDEAAAAAAIGIARGGEQAVPARARLKHALASAGLRSAGS